MNPLVYVRTAAVRKAIKGAGRRAGADFLEALDKFVEGKVKQAISTQLGAKKTVDYAVAVQIGVATPTPPTLVEAADPVSAPATT